MSRAGTFLWAVSYALRCRVTQALSRMTYPVESYPDVPQVTQALQRVEYLADTVGNVLGVTGEPGKRKLDFARHPSQVQRGILLGTEDAKVRVGDCEDYALYWTVASFKTGQTKDHRLVCVGWDTPSGVALSHMVAQFGWAGGTWWAGNWNRATPIKGTALEGVEQRTGRSATWAVRWTATPQGDDSVRLSAPQVLR